MDKYGLERSLKYSEANHKSILEFRKTENYVVTEKGSYIEQRLETLQIKVDKTNGSEKKRKYFTL